MKYTRHGTLYVVFLFCISFVVYAVNPVHEHKVSWIMDALQKDIGAYISPVRIHTLEHMLYSLLQAEPYTLYCVAGCALSMLQQQDDQSICMDELYKDDQEKKNVCTYLLKEQQKHLEAYYKQQYQQLSWFHQIRATFARGYYAIQNYFTGHPVCGDHEVTVLAEYILDYFAFERDMFLFHTQAALNFLDSQAYVSIPAIIHVWRESEQRNTLRLMLRSLTSNVTVQFWADIGVLVLQSMLFAGDSMYVQFLNEQDQKKFEAIAKQEKKIQDDFNSFIRKTKEDQKNIIKTIVQAFITKTKEINTQYETGNKLQNERVKFLFQSVNLNEPIVHDLESPALWQDQLFERSLMYVPSRVMWYNVFQIGDWQFDSSSNSFWQNSLAKATDQAWKALTGIDSPENNHIFTEYISSQASYAIEIECRLINVTYPFFAGIMFNKGRWISSDPERVHQYRLFGLYGNMVGKVPHIDIAFAQQKLENKEESTGTNKRIIITPLQQIVQDTTTHLQKVPEQDIAALIKEPLRYVFIVNTAPDQVSLQIKKIVHDQETVLFQTGKSGLESYLAIFHGIGFMATGCQAEFIIRKPETLVYSAQELQEFTKNVQGVQKVGAQKQKP